jgi:hypothetical protein
VSLHPHCYPDAVYEAFGSKYLSNLLQNLAELDFRTVEQGHPSLLTDIWGRIRVRFQKADEYEKVQLLEWIEPAAFHQPAAVLEIAREAMWEINNKNETVQNGDSKRGYLYSARSAASALPRLLRAITYHAGYRDEAVRRLWKLAKQDSREPTSYPEHALRVLKSVAAYSRYKPASFNLDVANTIQALCSEPDAFISERTPLDIVDELLKREGEEHESVGMKIILTWFGLDYSAVAPVRKICLQVLTECMASEDVAKSCRAFRSLSVLIHGFLPMHHLSAQEAKWHSDERQECLSILARRLAARSLHLPLAREIKATLESFVARGKNEETNARAREVLALLPKNANLEAFDAFCTADWDIRDPNNADDCHGT